MEHEIFKSKPLRGFPAGFVRGFIFGTVFLLISLALGMDDDMYIPLLGAFVVLGGIIGVIGCIGKKIEADENGVYLRKKEYLFTENDMYMNVHTHYYHAIPVTERYISVSGKNGKRTIKCSFLGGQDAGRLAKIVEDGMRKKYQTESDDFELNDVSVRYFPIPVAELTETIDKRCRLHINLMFWILTALFSLILISMIIQDQLEDYGLGFLGYMALNVLILGSVSFFICRKFKKSAKKIPYAIMLSDGQCFIDGKTFRRTDMKSIVMTADKGSGTGDMRKLVFYEKNGNISEYNFGFRADRKGLPGYEQLVEAIKENFGEIFSYDMC